MKENNLGTNNNGKENPKAFSVHRRRVLSNIWSFIFCVYESKQVFKHYFKKLS